MVVKKPKFDYVFRHNESLWAYESQTRIGTACLHFSFRNGRRFANLFIQEKKRGEWNKTLRSVLVKIPLEVMKAMVDEAEIWGRLRQKRYTYERIKIQDAHKKK